MASTIVRQNSKIASDRFASAPGNFEGSGSRPTQSSELARCHASLSVWMKEDMVETRGEPVMAVTEEARILNRGRLEADTRAALSRCLIALPYRVALSPRPIALPCLAGSPYRPAS
ncbi:protein of unknown function [Paraburkholderia kururiensis]